jgi:hypothetical protein
MSANERLRELQNIRGENLTAAKEKRIIETATERQVPAHLACLQAFSAKSDAAHCVASLVHQLRERKLGGLGLQEEGGGVNADILNVHPVKMCTR